MDAVRADGGDATAVIADVTDPGKIDHANTEALTAYGRLDVGGDDVGVTQLGGPEEIRYEQLKTCLTVNLDSVFLTAQTTISLLLEGPGGAIAASLTPGGQWATRSRRIDTRSLRGMYAR